MTRLPQDQTIAHAITDLAWCTTTPHSLEDIANASVGRFPRTRWDHGVSTDQMALDIKTEAEQYGGHTPHADPTADAIDSGSVYAMTRWADTGPATTAPVEQGDSGDTLTTDSLTAAVDLVYYSTGDLIILCLDSERITPTEGRDFRLDTAIVGLRRIQPLITQARDRMGRADRDLLDELVYQGIGETAEWMRAKGEALCNGSQRAGQPVPQPGQQPTGCVSCARDRDGAGRPYFEGIHDRFTTKRLCWSCGEYESGNGAYPPLGAVQYVHQTGKRLTTKVVEEAKRNEARASAGVRGA